MILYDKIKQRYSVNQIYKIFPKMSARTILLELGKIRIDVVIKYISFADIDYSLNDYIIDYEADKKYKEVKYVYKLLQQGKSIGGVAKKNGMTDHIDRMLKKGLDFNSEGRNTYKIIDILKIKINIDKFKLEKYNDHIELYSNEENLNKFKEKYKISHPVLYEPFKKSYHLAFDGMLAEYIKNYL